MSLVSEIPVFDADIVWGRDRHEKIYNKQRRNSKVKTS